MTFNTAVWVLLCSSVVPVRPDGASNQFFDPKKTFNLEPVYEGGTTGQGVNIAVVGIGGVYDCHAGLHKNYRTDLAYNACNGDNNAKEDNEHDVFGTLAAGLIAMVKDNRCGTGVAYNARITGIRWMCLWGAHSWREDVTQSAALRHKQEIIDIYLINWNRTPFTDLPANSKSALENGFNTGRKGKGSVFVYAVGMKPKLGPKTVENRACGGNPHANNPYVISVNGASPSGKALSYGLLCAAIYATTIAGDKDEPGITTTNLYNKCESKYTGTWAAGAFATGIIALILSANKDLTPRDIKHLMALGSEVKPLADNFGWRINKGGFWVNRNFGFGFMDASNMVNLAKGWTNVPPLIIETKTIDDEWGSKTRKRDFFKKLPCFGGKRLRKMVLGELNTFEVEYDGNINYLEEVSATVSIQSFNLLSLTIFLTSPAGFNVTLLEPLYVEQLKKGEQLKWTFKSTQTWGENPQGIWKFEVNDTITRGSKKKIGDIQDPVLEVLELTFYGTKETPGYPLPRRYTSFCVNTDGKTVCTE